MCNGNLRASPLSPCVRMIVFGMLSGKYCWTSGSGQMPWDNVPCGRHCMEIIFERSMKFERVSQTRAYQSVGRLPSSGAK